MKETVYIYGLASSKDLSNIRYVGKTVNMKARLNEHIRCSKFKSTYNYRWMNQEISQGYKIKIIQIDKVWKEDWDFWEIYWIQEYFKRGYKLTNLSPGGYQSDNMVEVIALTLNGKFIKKFNSIGAAADYFNLSEKRIADNVRGRNYYTKDKIFIKSSEYDPNKNYSIDKSIRRDRWKIIYQYDLQGNFIKEWKGAEYILKEFNMSRAVLSAVLTGRQLSSRGYIWSYSEDGVSSIKEESYKSVLAQYN